ncbi:GNAT family N-acetyltransferase [Pseudorhizobium flavum]|uniref:GNAT family N-acetyltransferase n=1 Tax=Pseudorhizobium flavum TaxID=1335061 RepID=UPI00376FC463
MVTPKARTTATDRKPAHPRPTPDAYDAWGRGYATEAAQTVLTYAFQTLGLDRVIADISPHNAASIRVAEKIGMKQLQAGRMVAVASAAAGAA